MQFNEVPPSVKSYARFTDPATAKAPAYRMFVYGTYALSNQPGQVMSLALMRAVLIDATVRNDGSMARDEESGSLMYEYPGLQDVFVAHPYPDFGQPRCTRCGQWKSEHANPNATACDMFVIHPPEDFVHRRCAECQQPLLHHGRLFTVACNDFIAITDD